MQRGGREGKKHTCLLNPFSVPRVSISHLVTIISSSSATFWGACSVLAEKSRPMGGGGLWTRWLLPSPSVGGLAVSEVGLSVCGQQWLLLGGW